MEQQNESKFKAKFNRYVSKLRSRQNLGPTNELSKKIAPNPIMQPFQYQAWKIVGKTFDFVAESHMKAETKVFKEFVYRFSRSLSGVFGFILLVSIILLAFIIPFTTLDPNFGDVDVKYLTFNQTDKNGVYHIFGTDSLGRDIWARLWHGLRYSLSLALVVTTIEVIIGLTIGILMGQYERFDRVMTFIIKVISVVPTIIILILITIVISPSFWVIVFALSFTSWTGMANQIRAQVKRAKHFEWVAASKVLGTPNWKILQNYVPVILPILITQLVFSIPGVVLSETSLAFIGLAIDDIPTLGNLILEGQKIFPTYLRYVFVPSTLLILITTSVQLIGASVQDALRRQR
ncbi:oligopeptide transport system permease protein [Mycoplasmopsis mustelae]|uniref:Oligopeptide transport system permease protein n=1 Tax=Mycoplasmopsis mustelae TaxID=171289 RepID=A0A4R7UDX9_9BACT|nr:ABC transporter permease [Mycoplasmopsis mustelae]TDV24276.1 oligopeptide transport system permease protein [Mycoplasmopsis mustelae]